MKCLVLYSKPPIGGESIQGHMLYKGLKKLGINAESCDYQESLEKSFSLKNPDVKLCYGVGSWIDVPEIVLSPLKHNVRPIPWFNSDGWVANHKKAFEELDLMFTTSDWVKGIYQRDGVDVSKIFRAHIGIDTNLFKPNNDTERNLALRRAIGVKDNEKMILTIGGDTTSKGSQEMFKALSDVNKEFKDWKYVCKSWPSDCAREWREREIALAKELNILDKIIFIDDIMSQEFMAQILNSCDLYVAPSRIEGFGMIQVEAMACGKPVISINKMGPSETILHNKTGFLAKVAEEIQLEQEWALPSMGFKEKHLVKFEHPKTFAYKADIDDLREFTHKLLTDNELRETMGNQAREHALQKFDYRVTSKHIWDITKRELGLD